MTAITPADYLKRLKGNKYGKGRKVPGQLNKTEERYQQRLADQVALGQVLWYAYESLKLEVGPGSWYVPDFWVMRADGQMECHEIKGSYVHDEKSRVKFKAAAGKYPLIFRWCVWEPKVGWTITTPLPEDA